MPNNTKKRARDRPPGNAGPPPSEDDDGDTFPSRKSQCHPSASDALNEPQRKRQKLGTEEAEISSSDASVLGSAVIDVVEGDSTVTWAPRPVTSASMADASAVFQTLLAPHAFEQFVEKYFHPRRPVFIPASEATTLSVLYPSDPVSTQYSVLTLQIKEKSIWYRWPQLVDKRDPPSARCRPPTLFPNTRFGYQMDGRGG